MLFRSDAGGLLEGPRRGMRIDRFLPWLDFKRGMGLPDFRDPDWMIGDPLPVSPEEVAAEPFYNSWLYTGPDDFLLRGMGIKPSRKGVRRGPDIEAYWRACGAIAKAIPTAEQRMLFDASRLEGTRHEAMPKAPSPAERSVPSWYRPSALIVASYPAVGASVAWIEVWPHPHDAGRAHVFAHVNTLKGWQHYAAPPDGYLPEEIDAALGHWCDAACLP